MPPLQSIPRPDRDATLGTLSKPSARRSTIWWNLLTFLSRQRLEQKCGKQLLPSLVEGTLDVAGARSLQEASPFSKAKHSETLSGSPENDRERTC